MKKKSDNAELSSKKRKDEGETIEEPNDEQDVMQSTLGGESIYEDFDDQDF